MLDFVPAHFTVDDKTIEFVQAVRSWSQIKFGILPSSSLCNALA